MNRSEALAELKHLADQASGPQAIFLRAALRSMESGDDQAAADLLNQLRHMAPQTMRRGRKKTR